MLTFAEKAEATSPKKRTMEKSKTLSSEVEKEFESLSTNNKAFQQADYPPMMDKDAGFPGYLEDFHWDNTTDEPHKTRRKLIIQKHPEIKELFGHCWKTKYSVTFLVSAQFLLAFYLRDKMWTMEYWAIAYVFGATMTHSLFLAIHEITHFLAFEKPNYNRYLATFANLPIGLPYWAAFRGYHMEHHTLQGTDSIDTDLPTRIEGVIFSTTLGKLFFCTFQILFYAVRPMMVRAQTFTAWHLFNWVVQFSVMGAMIYHFGPNPFYYFLTSTFLSGSLHPMAGHFLAEHFVFVKGYETYSYYGPLNLLAYNVGYHNEHHDFPRIPGSRLPLVRKIAPEFYNDLPQVSSWPGTIYNFIVFPHMSPWSRYRRPLKAKSD